MNKKIILGVVATAVLGMAGAGIASIHMHAKATETKAVISSATEYKIDVSNYSGWNGMTSGLYMYAWNSSDEALLGSWPGTAIESSAISNNIITYTLPANTNGFLVHNNNGTQTKDIYACDVPGATYTLPSDLNNYGEWEDTYDGWYIMGSATEWKYSASNKNTSAPSGYLAKWEGFSFAKDETFKMTKLVGCWLQGNYYQGWDRVINSSALSGYIKNETSEDKPNLLVEFAGSYDIALNES